MDPFLLENQLILAIVTWFAEFILIIIRLLTDFLQF